MATRSLIGIANAETGKVKFVYCHSDGYLSHNGKILHEHWQDVTQVERLIGLKDLSLLSTTLGEKHDFEWLSKFWDRHGYDVDNWSEDAKAEYSRLTSYTRAYERDRGEATKTRKAVAADDFWAQDVGTEYWYLYQNRAWWVKAHDEEPMLLADALELEAAAEAAE